MKLTGYLAIALAIGLLAACGGNDQEVGTLSQSTASDPVASNPEPELGGRYELNAEAPFAVTVENAQLNCQSAFPGQPFRAQWNDDDSKTAVLVTGFQTDGTNETRVDNFQVVYFGGTRDQQARLTGARLEVTEISRQGQAAIYAVSATGEFVEGGSFTASGTCRA